MKLLLLTALLGVAYVAAECPEACNGHGFCGEYDKPVHINKMLRKYSLSFSQRGAPQQQPRSPISPLSPYRID